MAQVGKMKRERSENFDYERLAEIIILNSAKDYCFAIKTLLRNPHSHIALRNKIDIEELRGLSKKLSLKLIISVRKDLRARFEPKMQLSLLSVRQESLVKKRKHDFRQRQRLKRRREKHDSYGVFDPSAGYQRIHRQPYSRDGMLAQYGKEHTRK